MAAPVTALSVDYPRRHLIPPHVHDRGQLVYASEGVMRVSTPSGAWVVPPQRGVWIPAGVEHSILTASRVSMRTLYFADPLARRLPRACRLVHVTPLLKELVLRAMSLDGDRRPTARERRLQAVLLDEMASLPVSLLRLPAPRDERLRRLVSELEARPDANVTLELWASRVGASSRTLARLFTRETGMSFRRYREQLRLLLALERLARGDSVKSVSSELGYASESAFAVMFRRNLGAAPSRYFRPENVAPASVG